MRKVLELALVCSVVVLASAAGVAACSRTSGGERKPLRVAAAADLSLAFPEVGAEYERTTGEKVTFSFGASGLLAKQIAEGAPFDAFAAANVAFVDDTVRAGACDAATKSLFARGELTLVTAQGTSASPAPARIQDLADPRYKKIAIANPEHAPYGRAAEQALRRAGIWEAVRPRLVFGENIQQTLQFAQSGNADVALVSRSLVRAGDGATVPVPAELHDPIDQAVVSCTHGASTEGGRRFVAFLQSPTGRAILERHGFGLPRARGE